MIEKIRLFIENPILFFSILFCPFFLYYSDLILWQYWLFVSIIVISFCWLWVKPARILAIFVILYTLISFNHLISEKATIPKTCSTQIDNLTGTLKSKIPDTNNKIQLSNVTINCQSDSTHIPIALIQVTPETLNKIKWLRPTNIVEISNFKIVTHSRFVIEIKPEKKIKIFNISRKHRILSRSRLLIYVQKKADYFLSPFVSGLFQSIVTADKTLLSKSLKNKIRTMGIAHIFAISGLHIGIIYFWLTIALRLGLWLPFKYLNNGTKLILIDFISIAVVFGYIVVIGAPISATRAFIMLCWWCVVRHLFSWQPLHFILIGTALLILINNPLIISLLSFQLSFISVLGIIMILPFLPVSHTKAGIFKKINNSIISSLMISGWLFVINLPLLSRINDYYTLTNIISNTIHVLYLGCFFLPLAIGIFCFTVISYPFYSFPGELYLYAILNVIGKLWEQLMDWNYSWHKLFWWEFGGAWGIIKSTSYWSVLLIIWFVLIQNRKIFQKMKYQIYKPNSASN